MSKEKKEKPKVYSIDEVCKAVNNWSMTTVDSYDIKKFLENSVKDENQLKLFHG